MSSSDKNRQPIFPNPKGIEQKPGANPEPEPVPKPLVYIPGKESRLSVDRKPMEPPATGYDAWVLGQPESPDSTG